MKNNEFKIGIVSLGLIGGSIYKTFYAYGFKNLYCLTSNKSTLKDIISDGFNASDKTDILKDCDLIFICSPISETVNMIKKCFAINPDAIYVDVASLKKDILYQIENDIPDCKFIGSHPMAGTENTGFNASFSGLFKDATWVITPSQNVNDNNIELVTEIINLLGAKVLKIDADEHDKAVALISHTPLLLSQALMLSVFNNDIALTLAASGFRDMTRLSMSNKTMARDMLNLNRDNIKSSLLLIIDEAQKLLNSDYFDKNIDKIIDLRKNLYNELGKNNHQ